MFSATDVIEEYTRPARIVEEGRVVTRPALSEVETIEVPGVGTLEAFLTDGLARFSRGRRGPWRRRRFAIQATREAMRGLRESGFLTRADSGGRRIRLPRAVTEGSFRSPWKLREGEKEFTFLRVSPCGPPTSGRRLLLRTPRPPGAGGGATSMARTTGFPGAVAAAMLAREQYRDPGVRPLELLASDPAASARFLEALRARGLAWTEDWERPILNPKSKIQNPK